MCPSGVVRQCPPMTDRRGDRRSHVRPRAPSTGRPGPVKVRPKAPTRERLAVHKPVRRSAGLPLPAKLILAFALVALGVAVLFAGRGGLAQIVGTIGSAFSGFVEEVTATPTPTPVPTVLLEVPSLDAPQESYTNAPAVDITGSVPPQFVGRSDVRIRLYVTLPELAPAPIAEQSISGRATFLFPGIELTKGANEFSASLVAADGTESEASAPIRYVLDTSKPKITITSPEDGAVINGATVEIVGKTQARSTVQARNEANSTSATTSAASDGTFTLVLAIEAGTNGISLTATDPAGNQGSFVLSVLRGSGTLMADLTASAYRFRLSKLPQNATLTVVVTDPDGRPLEGATALFTLSIPGVPTVTSDSITDATGSAVFATTIAVGATEGTGVATVLVTTSEFGEVTARTVITIIP